MAALVSRASADNPSYPKAATASLARELLAAELAGLAAERQAKLDAALEQSPDDLLARGLGGFVRDGQEWRRYDDTSHVDSQRELLADYDAMRAQQPDSVEGQLRAADWCAKNKLPDQERAHLTRVLELAPDHGGARTRLGFVLVDGVWLNREEVLASGARARAAAKTLASWQPKLLALRAALMSEASAARQKAAEQVAAIRDAEAIPALEGILSRAGDEAAEAVIESLANMPEPEASIALARQAVLQAWYPLGERAAEHLKRRPRDHYVPALLSAMYTPVQSWSEIYSAPDGRLMYSHSFYREGESQRELQTLTTAYTLRGAASESALRAANRAQGTAKIREATVESRNEAADRFNDAICRALAAATGEKVTANPTSWWQWWNDYNEVYSPAPKPLYQEHRYAEQTIVTLPSPARGRHECLVAGTPVWTSVGPVAIEKLKIGDLVLAQDPRTGVLAYKPVLRTTVRPEGPLVEFTAGGERIRCSGGHPFWVSGTGWVKARELKPGAVLHGVDGGLPVTATADAPAETTYNLIVADSHSYFVGTSRLLSHDNTIRRATSGGLPGVLSVAPPAMQPSAK